jgi:hypothetical protein
VLTATATSTVGDSLLRSAEFRADGVRDVRDDLLHAVDVTLTRLRVEGVDLIR